MITKVVPRYGTLFLTEPSVLKAGGPRTIFYDLTIQWNSPSTVPRQLLVSLNGKALPSDHIQLTGDRAIVRVDLTNDPQVQDGPNKLAFRAKTGECPDCTASALSRAEFLKSRYLPDWLNGVLIGHPQVRQASNQYTYTFKRNFPNTTQPGDCGFALAIPASVPLFGGGTLKLPRPQGTLEATISTRANIGGTLQGSTCLTIPLKQVKRQGTQKNLQMNATISGSVSGSAGANGTGVDFYLEKGTLRARAAGQATTSAPLAILVPYIGQALAAADDSLPPRFKSWVDAVSLEAGVNAGMTLSGNWESDGVGFNPEVESSLEFRSLKLQGTLGGTITLKAKAPSGVAMSLSGKVETTAELVLYGGPGDRTGEQELRLDEVTITWSVTGKVAYKGETYGLTGTCVFSNKTAEVDCSLAPTSLAGVTSDTRSIRLHGVASSSRNGTLDDPMGLLQTAVSDEASPALALWQQDITQHAALLWRDGQEQQTVLRARVWDGASWNAPVALTTDANPKFTPRLVADGNGHLVAVWEQAVGATAEEPLGPTYLTKFELFSSVYDIAAGTWSTPSALTTNTAFDHSPALARGQDGSVLLTWLQNAAGRPGSTPAQPTLLLARAWNGSNWNAPTTVATHIEQASAALHNATSGTVLALWDADGDPATTGDAQLLTSIWNGAGWSTPVALAPTVGTLDGLRTLYTPTGEPHYLWTEGERLMSQRGTTRTVIVEPLPANLTAPATAVDGQGNIVLLYQSGSLEGGDLYRVTYDAGAGQWGEPVQLTHDRDLESDPAIAIAGDGSLWIGTVKTAVQTSTVRIGSEQVPNMPTFGQSDLQVLRHTLGADLAVDTIELPEMLTPGTASTITATVRNAGDLVARTVAIALQDNGTTVTEQTLPALASGAEQVLTFNYTPPSDGQVHTLGIVADPNHAIAELDEINNHRTRLGLGPDMSIETAGVEYTVGNLVQIVAEIANHGSAPATASTLSVTDELSGSSPLLSIAVPPLSPGESTSVSGWWNSSGAVSGSHPLRLLVDSTGTVTETDEINNAAAVEVRIGPDLALTDYGLAADRRSIDVRVENQGIRSAPASPLWLVPSSVLSIAPVWRGSTPALAVGEAVTITVSLDQPIPEVFRLWVDPEDTLLEPIEWNNVVGEGEAAQQRKLFLPLVRR